MLQQQTIEKLHSLKLYGMANEFQRQLDCPEFSDLAFEERLGMLGDAEVHNREQRRQDRAMKMAKLALPNACVEDIDYRKSRGLDKAYLQSLFTCDWVNRKQHIAVTGSTGGGKSHLACALAHQAIRKGNNALFYRAPRLIEDMEIARLDGSLPKLRLRLMKFKILIIDDWALSPLSPNSQQDLLEIIEDRTGRGSLIMTSQLPVSKWHDYIGEPTFADAIMDRIVHRAHKIELHGGSMRRVFNTLKEKSDE